jgi:hypothetical protein
MAGTVAGNLRNGQRAPDRARAAVGPTPSTRRRRQPPLVAVGVLLVLGCALAFTVASEHMRSQQEVLVVTQPLGAGQVLTSADLGTAEVSTGGGLQAIPEVREASVLGRSVSVPMVRGALLTTTEVGATASVASGSDVVAMGLKAGGFPPDLGQGDRVQVVPVSSSDSGSGTGSVGSGSPVSATVVAVQPASADSGSPTVFSLLISKGNADEVAALAAAGQASLVQVGVGS